MSKESHNIEWKVAWRDEHIKWIAGFANAQGGNLFIGVDNAGNIIGISDAQKLLEEIPNKVRDTLGILVQVNFHDDSGKEYLEIKVDQYPYPVSYRGQYFLRSGSTNQELKNAALDHFLLNKIRRRWDASPITNVSIEDLSEDAIATVRYQSPNLNRLPPGMESESREMLLNNLRLTEGGHLKRAAILLFHPEPDRFISGAFVKIGYFKTDDDLLFQDLIKDPLFLQVNQTMDLLVTKYLKARISYSGVYRTETPPFPHEAIREALLNAIAHKDYSSGVPIQISVYEDKIIFWNHGQLPDHWTTARLKQKHPSIPYNPDIAYTFFITGLIESWGRGTLKILSEFKKANLDEPRFESANGEFSVTFLGSTELHSPIDSIYQNVEIKLQLPDRKKTQEYIIQIIKQNPSATINDLSKILGKTNRTIERQLRNLQERGLIIRVGAKKTGMWKIVEAG